MNNKLKIMTVSELEVAVATLSKALRNDKDLFYCYQANIAMAFKDEYHRKRKNYMNNKDIHDVANDAAKNFLKLLINI